MLRVILGKGVEGDVLSARNTNLSHVSVNPTTIQGQGPHSLQKCAFS